MKEQDFLELLRKHGALLEGHFQFTSGLHSNMYLQMAQVLQHPDVAERLCRTLAEPYRDQRVSVVVAPAVGAIIVAHEVARALGVRAIFTERMEGKMVLRRGFSVSHSDRVLVVEDVVTTGGTTLEVAKHMLELGSSVVGTAAIVCRGSRPQSEIPFHSLATLRLFNYSPQECPLCRQGVPLSVPGSRGLERR